LVTAGLHGGYANADEHFLISIGGIPSGSPDLVTSSCLMPLVTSCTVKVVVGMFMSSLQVENAAVGAEPEGL
jgi:hypothetical protein